MTKSTESLRDTLLRTKPKVHSFEIDGQTYYLRELNVGETNNYLYGQRQQLIQIAQEQGIELDYDDEEKLEKQLRDIYDPLGLARTIATRLCDEKGVNLFDPNNKDDLVAISNLSSEVFDKFTAKVIGLQPKNSTADVSSK